jgi:hypothetical protein
MYEALHATAEQTTVTTTCGGRGGCSSNTTRTLYLANGTQVHHPEDILPIVAADSAAARSVQASLRSRSTRRVYTVVALAGLLAAAIAIREAWSQDEVEFTTGTKALAIGGAGAMLVGSIGSYYYNEKAADEHGDANTQYNEGLASRLKVCTRGFGVVACEDARPSTELAPPGN